MSKRKPAAALTLEFPQLERKIESHAGETIYQSARRCGVRIIGACGGRGTCGTCRVHVVEGEIDMAGEKALAGAASGGKKPQWVRACQVTPKSDCVVEVAARSLAQVARAEFDAGGTDEILALDPAVASRDIDVPQATLADNLSDLDRVIRALASPLPAVDLLAARQLPAMLRAYPRV
jgi:ferredoxin